MTRRERIMATCLAGTLAGLGLVYGVRRAILRPFDAVRAEIRTQQLRQSKLRNRLRELERVDKEWQTLTARTLATQANEAQSRFRRDLTDLLERHGLHDQVLTPGTPTEVELTGGEKKKGPTLTAQAVPLYIKATGTLNQIVGFLCDFYRRDYLARLDQVTISADPGVISSINSSRGGGPGHAGRNSAEFGPDGPELKLDVTAVTLVLPKLPGVPHPLMAEITEQPAGRLLRDLGEYSEIVKKSVFAPPQEPREIAHVPPPTPPQPPRDANAHSPPPPPPPPQRPNADKIFVRGTVNLHGERMALVVDQSQADRPITRYRLDDPIDDGILLLILPGADGGLVVRVEQPGQPAREYFYPLGKSFAEREEVREDAHPDIVAALRNEFEG